MKQFFEVRVELSKHKDPSDHIVARLAELGFDGFQEEDEFLLAYMEKEAGTEKSDISSLLDKENISPYTIGLLDDKNWNETWESDYTPAVISADIIVRAPFHQAAKGVKHDIIIEPRMAFGTAHHETTSQMLRMITSMDIKGKSVLDMGCGTAVLAILAYQMGAGDIMAVDNDEWAYKNSLDNIELNGAGNIRVELGDAALLQNLRFDIIFANINRNILLEDIPAYCNALNEGGLLLMSGFYVEDLPLIGEKAKACGLAQGRISTENNWTAAEFKMNRVT